MIVSAQYTDASHDTVRVRLGDGAVLFCPWPAATWYGGYLAAWVAAGNAILAEDPPPSPIDLANLENLERALKALGLVTATWAGKTPEQLKTAFKVAYESLG